MTSTKRRSFTPESNAEAGRLLREEEAGEVRGLEDTVCATLPAMNYQSDIDSHKEMLDRLLAAQPGSYSEGPPADEALKTAAGVYHFFQVADGQRKSIYIGKGGFGEGEKWSLYRRMRQHFQPSQEWALLGKASRATGKTPDECKAKFAKDGLCLQWLVICDRSSKHSSLDAEIRWFEYFAISVLKPQYTDG